MSDPDNRKPPAHEQLNDIADKLDEAIAQGTDADKITPYTRQPSTESPTAQSAAYEVPRATQDSSRAPPLAEPVAVAVTPAAATKSESRLRTALVTFFPMLIAVMSLGLSMYQGYLFNRSIDLSARSLDLIERNVARGEYIRTCREVIETYFVVKQKVSVLMPAADRSNVVGASRVTEANKLEAQAAIARFGGLGTYLANFQDPGTRARYTELTRTLNGIMDNARATPLTELDKLFEPADKLFTAMNDDCVRLARTMRL